MNYSYYKILPSLIILLLNTFTNTHTMERKYCNKSFDAQELTTKPSQIEHLQQKCFNNNSLNVVIILDKDHSYTQAKQQQIDACMTHLLAAINSNVIIIASSSIILGLTLLKFPNCKKSRLMKKKLMDPSQWTFCKTTDNSISYTLLIPKDIRENKLVDLSRMQKLMTPINQNLINSSTYPRSTNPNINLLTNILSKNSKIKKRIYLCGHGHYKPRIIAGMSLNEYTSLLIKFNKINCDFFCN